MPTMNSIMMTIYGKMLHFIIKLCLYKLKIILRGMLDANIMEKISKKAY